MKPKLVLVVDVDESDGARAAGMIADCGHRVVTARSVEAAIELLHRHTDVALVLCEVMLPGESGFVLLDRMQMAFEGLPVVLLTKALDVRLGVQAFRRGAVDVLQKPLHMPSLRACIVRALQCGRMQRARALDRRRMERVLAERTRELRRVVADLERSYDVTIEAMGDALDLRDEETEGHSKRVTAYTVALARKLRLGPDELKTVARGAFLHDVGKIAIPDAILLKPGRLTAGEMEIMRSHCEHGYAIVRKIPFLEDAAEIVFTHQERFDGTGYPRGLRGEQIPLGSRVFALADTLDAITSDRPYRKASSFAHALSEIEKCSGTQFDPQIVDAFLAMPQSSWPAIRAEIGRNCHASELVRAAAA